MKKRKVLDRRIVLRSVSPADMDFSGPSVESCVAKQRDSAPWVPEWEPAVGSVTKPKRCDGFQSAAAGAGSHVLSYSRRSEKDIPKPIPSSS